MLSGHERTVALAAWKNARRNAMRSVYKLKRELGLCAVGNCEGVADSGRAYCAKCRSEQKMRDK